MTFPGSVNPRPVLPMAVDPCAAFIMSVDPSLIDPIIVTPDPSHPSVVDQSAPDSFVFHPISLVVACRTASRAEPIRSSSASSSAQAAASHAHFLDRLVRRHAPNLDRRDRRKTLTLRTAHCGQPLATAMQTARRTIQSSPSAFAPTPPV